MLNRLKILWWWTYHIILLLLVLCAVLIITTLLIITAPIWIFIWVITGYWILNFKNLDKLTDFIFK